MGDYFQYKYDSSGNLTGVTDPLGSTTQMTYTAQGELASYTDANSNVTQSIVHSLGHTFRDHLSRRHAGTIHVQQPWRSDVDRSAQRPGD